MRKWKNLNIKIQERWEKSHPRNVKWSNYFVKLFGNYLKAKQTFTIWPSNYSTPGCLPERNKNMCSCKDFYTNVHRNNPDAPRTGEWTNTAVHLSTGLLLGSEEEQTTDTQHGRIWTASCWMKAARHRRAHTVWFYSKQDKLSSQKGSQWLPGIWRVGKLLIKGHQKTFWGNGNILQINCSIYMDIHMSNFTELCT